MSTEQQLTAALRVLLAADDGDTPLDNQLLAAALGWDLEETATCLQALKDRSLIWGVRGSGKPGPWYSELEVTVQGRRFLGPCV